MIAVNKPPGMVVHPAPGSPNGTFANALVNYLNTSANDILGNGSSTMRPGIIHRLDKGSSGVLLAAKSQKALGLLGDRKSVVLGQSVSVRVDLGGGRFIKKKNNK